jgi:hypothetical protein
MTPGSASPSCGQTLTGEQANALIKKKGLQKMSTQAAINFFKKKMQPRSR